MTYLIREAEAGDRAALRAMVGELHDQVKVYDKDLAETTEILEAYMASLERRVAETEGAFYVAVGASHDDYLGYVCVLGCVLPDADERPDTLAVVTDLYARESARGLGIGAGLLARAEEHGRARGASTLELNVLAKNGPARTFYERQGYYERVIVQAKRLEG